MLDPDKVVRLLVFSLLGQIGVSRYLVASDPRPRYGRRRLPARRTGTTGRTAPGCSRCLEAPPWSEDLDLRQGPTERDRAPHALGMQVVVPMMLQGECKGLLLLGEKLSRERVRQRRPRPRLASLGNLAIISLENARLFKEAIEKQKMEDELQIAREIQKGLLPSVLPAIPGSLKSPPRNMSSKQVGGDYYDVIPLRRREHHDRNRRRLGQRNAGVAADGEPPGDDQGACPAAGSP